MSKREVVRSPLLSSSADNETSRGRFRRAKASRGKHVDPDDDRKRERARSLSRSSESSSEASSSERSRDSKRNAVSRKAKRFKKSELKRLRDALIGEKFGYSDEFNPFGDANLSAPFVWEKKEKLLRAAGKSVPTDEFLEQTQRKIREIEQVKKRREEREKEERALEEQQALLARERELETYSRWEQKEEVFHREMLQKKTYLRLKQGRATICDLLVKALRLLDGEKFETLTLSHLPPHELFEELPLAEAAELFEDVKIQAELYASMPPEESTSEVESWARGLGELGSSETAPEVKYEVVRHAKFWDAMLLIGTQAMANRREKGQTNAEMPRDLTTGIATAALDEMKKLLGKKSKKELEQLQPEIQKKLKAIRNDPTSMADPTYWETVLELMPYCKAVALCREIHEEALSAAADQQDEKKRAEYMSANEIVHPGTNDDLVDTDPVEPTGVAAVIEENLYYPPLQAASEFGELIDIALSPEEFAASRRSLRSSLIEQRLSRRVAVSSNEKDDTENIDDANQEIYDKFVSREQQTMQEDEFIMTPAYEVPVPYAQAAQSQTDWDFRYPAKKPRFFNRVKTGYEWTKYNQSHYDRDNPPPKAVQGYKFNLFYPELIDNSKPPKWTLLPTADKETILIQFHGGPPYEDVRFRIINREWDMHPRSGFKNTFDRGKKFSIGAGCVNATPLGNDNSYWKQHDFWGSLVVIQRSTILKYSYDASASFENTSYSSPFPRNISDIAASRDTSQHYVLSRRAV